ncbi:MAG TPA: type II toxin-antitoxin system RelE/ParE family toxin [Humisphaera sp.]|jgi:plasmid stabilization system protein ParE|nr:type II toxin-antitoxin system RelE/ParE family toxin [Humisphaera sp.]
MTKYTVIITPEAQDNITDAFDYIRERSPLNAARWIRGLYRLIDDLELMPTRFGDAREQAYFEEDLRQIIYKSHRVIYLVDEARRHVNVLYVRHAKRRAIGEPDSAE